MRSNLSNKVHEGVDMLSEKLEEGRRMVQEQGGIRGAVEKGIERGERREYRHASRYQIRSAGNEQTERNVRSRQKPRK